MKILAAHIIKPIDVYFLINEPKVASLRAWTTLIPSQELRFSKPVPKCSLLKLHHIDGVTGS